ncbi:AraC family transcriptional regulator [Exilibacterium tricleocarpae]|uniref:AraC family transcriptional regulator n=1 Tax=Exilibacterium tricleocarpae TaxID=2591008 RepID=A0A545TNF1_9GAMM|nr:AraC family transcriptional regulator [Exilibacterium tricleocarpae]TQV78749.1 AraC family transcriptional regulator [Exilibacterium tricleocarpae]
MKRAGFHGDEKVIALQGPPLTLIKLAQQRGCDINKLLRGTRLFSEDLHLPGVHISPNQWRQLVANAERLCGDEELCFQLGHRALSDCDPALDRLLNSCQHLAQLLQQLVRYHPLLQPLTYIHARRGNNTLLLLCGADAKGNSGAFLTAALLSWLTRVLKRQWGRDYPLTVEFAWPQPKAIHQYQEYFGQQIAFGRWQSGILIAPAALYRPFSLRDREQFDVNASRCRQLIQQTRTRHSLLVQTRRLLYAQLHRQPDRHHDSPLYLEQVAACFGMSPTTFKRRLKREETSFQHLQDQVRKEAALFLLRHEGWKNNQLASYLQFTDVNNFRRAFKRWTGLLPSELRQAHD